MTRLLFPDAFGVVAAATALIVGLQLLSDFGVRTVIIQSPNGEDSGFLRSGWSFKVPEVSCCGSSCPSLVHCCMCQMSVHFFGTSSVFADPAFPAVAIALGLGLVLNGIKSTAIPLNVRKLNFRPIVIFDLTAKAHTNADHDRGGLRVSKCLVDSGWKPDRKRTSCDPIAYCNTWPSNEVRMEK